MLRTQEALANLVNYEKVSGIRSLNPPKIEKKEIANFFLCQNFEKALQKVDRAMERYNGKVDQLKERLNQSDNNIKDLERSFKSVNPGQGFFVDKTDAGSVAKYNDRLDQARRLQERISDAIDKHNVIVADHNEAIREAKEKMVELTEEAIRVIDEDIVAVLDKCTRVASKLSQSANSEDCISALEICFIEYKLLHSFEDHIEGNVARKDAKERLLEVNKIFVELCLNKEVKNYFAELFYKNAFLIQKNGDLFNQTVKVVAGVNQDELKIMTESFDNVLAENFNTEFKFQGIIDPTELNKVVVDINNTIDSIKLSIDKNKELFASTQNIAEVGYNAHQTAETIFANMKNNVDLIKDDLLHIGHFACEIIDETVIDDFHQKDVRPSINSLRTHIVNHIGKEQFDTLLVANDDRHFITKTETAINQADLLRLQIQRNKVDAQVQKLLGYIKKLETDIQKVGQVPQENADALRSLTATLYIISFIPILGFAFALWIMNKIKKFGPGFKSENEIYQLLCKDILAKNKTIQKVNLILGFAVGICALGGFLIFKISTNMAVNIGIPIIILVLYLVTWLILSNVSKNLDALIQAQKTKK